MLFLYCVCLKYCTFWSRQRIWAFAAPDSTEPAAVHSMGGAGSVDCPGTGLLSFLWSLAVSSSPGNCQDGPSPPSGKPPGSSPSPGKLLGSSLPSSWMLSRRPCRALEEEWELPNYCLGGGVGGSWEAAKMFGPGCLVFRPWWSRAWSRGGRGHAKKGLKRECRLGLQVESSNVLGFHYVQSVC